MRKVGTDVFLSLSINFILFSCDLSAIVFCIAILNNCIYRPKTFYKKNQKKPLEAIKLQLNQLALISDTW